MRGFVGEFHDLVFDRRTISWSDRLNLAAIHGRAMHVLANDALGFGRGPGDVARHLRIVMSYAFGAEAERCRIGVARLKLELRPVDSASVEARRGSGFEAAAAQAELFERFAEKDSG